ncbi:CoA transferase [Aurantimonas sp. DM33-3]|uniref:CoA transferase n=1 Tax=Aurantimonas sp. DM33-3 TaxID=2766955 RepID=UPI00165281C7|nr:CoA transferase [Aurantimonas sp. DM33-3]
MNKPLAGLRVVDLGIITAGASTSAILADLGAEVIKVEGPNYIDPFRRWAESGDGDNWWNHSPYFRFTNRNKKSVCLDLKSPEGRDLFLDLVAASDVVVENFRVGVLDRLGVGFGALRAHNSRIVLGSISSQGTSGPDANAVSFGSTLEASAGFADLVRYADGPPRISGQALNYPDQVVSLFAAGLIMSTILEARRTGKAMHVDISQREVTAFLLGEHLVSAVRGATDRTNSPVRRGLNDEGIYASRDGKWVAVSLPAGSLLITSEIAAGARGDVRKHVADIVRALDGVDAVTELTALGACARVVVRVEEMVREAKTSLAFATAPNGEAAKGLPWRYGDRPLEIETPARDLGADNHGVVVGLLGRSESAFLRLVREGVLSTAPSQPT